MDTRDLTSEREMMGRNYMALAVQYGHIELKAGVFLYSGKGLKELADKAGKALFEDGEFYFMKGRYIYGCYGADNVMDCIEADGPGQGFNLPVIFETARKIIPFEMGG